MKEKPIYNVVHLSGGKDSTAMLLKMIDENMPIDEIIFCDTGLEFDEMYVHLDKLEKYIGRPITRLKAEHSFEYYFFEYSPKRKNPALAEYSGMSWAGPMNHWCTGILKQRVTKKYLRKLREKYTIKEYIGIAADEKDRIKNACYPLVMWGMTEADCLAFCKSLGFDWGGLYDIFKRVSCWCCPLQSLSELRKLRKHFPQKWEQLKRWDRMTWRSFRKDYSVDELEIRFEYEEECLANGLSIRSKTFFIELRKRIERMRNNEKAPA